MAVLTHFQGYWRAYLLNAIFVSLLLTTHTLAYADQVLSAGEFHTSRVANIAPGESIQVELHYVETLNYDQGRFTLRVPTTLTPRYVPGQLLDHAGASPRLDRASGWARPTASVPDAPVITPFMQESQQAATLNFRALIKPGFALNRIASLHQSVDIVPQSSSYDVRLRSGARLDRDAVLEWEPALGEAPLAAALHEVKDNDYYLLMLMPPQVSASGEITAFA